MEPERLAELTLEHGFSAFILAVSAADDIRAFAEDVAPRVRELVRAGRSGERPATAAPADAGAQPFSVTPTPDAAAARAPGTSPPARPARRPTPSAATRPTSRPPAST